MGSLLTASAACGCCGGSRADSVVVPSACKFSDCAGNWDWLVAEEENVLVRGGTGGGVLSDVSVVVPMEV